MRTAVCTVVGAIALACVYGAAAAPDTASRVACALIVLFAGVIIGASFTTEALD